MKDFVGSYLAFRDEGGLVLDHQKWGCKYVFDPDGVRKRVQSNDSVTKNHHLLGACSVSMRFGTFFGDLESIWGSKKGGSSMRGDPPSSELDEWGHR